MFLRLPLLWGCRHYLLNTLYSDLRGLSTSTASHSDDDIELDDLPAPSTHTPKPGGPDSAFLHESIARWIFSWTFSECCTLFILLIMQGANVFSSSVRLANWRIALGTLVLFTIVTIPAAYGVVLAMGNTGRVSFLRCGPRTLLNFIPVALFVIAFAQVPLPSALIAADMTTATVARLIVVGTVFIGVLSGFGAISNCREYLPFFSGSKKIPSEADIRVAEHALSSVQDDLRQRRLAAHKRANEANQQSWLSRVGTSFRGGDDFTQEMKGLESLEYQMNKNLQGLRKRREAGLQSQTLRGKVTAVLQQLFAVYCVTRILGCLYNLTFLPSQRSSSNLNYSDLLANVLAYGLSRISATPVPTEDIAAFSRQLSLALVGLIILTSIRLVLRGVTQLLRVTSRSLGASLMLLFLSQVMATYLLSTIIQMRSSFPPPPSTPDQQDAVVNLFSTVPEYEVFGSLFDWTFLLASAASAFVFWFAKKVTGSDDLEHD
ncbi:G protein-coupled receptor 89 [Coprinellus micaceus]|uniref:G protein-coupled receptor 89 n=1 Tax=Coprinellus micaceus TaxID=71717 RepID=A0A4Y7TK89_COPMI|nr:G protein-coupled receptor 89 [Coprinellus micaceus]